MPVSEAKVYVLFWFYIPSTEATFVLAGYLGPSHKKRFNLCIEEMIQDNLEFMPLKNILHPRIGYLNSLGYFNLF